MQTCRHVAYKFAFSCLPVEKGRRGLCILTQQVAYMFVYSYLPV